MQAHQTPTTPIQAHHLRRGQPFLSIAIKAKQRDKLQVLAQLERLHDEFGREEVRQQRRVGKDVRREYWGRTGRVVDVRMPFAEIVG